MPVTSIQKVAVRWTQKQALREPKEWDEGRPMHVPSSKLFNWEQMWMIQTLWKYLQKSLTRRYNRIDWQAADFLEDFKKGEQYNEAGFKKMQELIVDYAEFVHHPDFKDSDAKDFDFSKVKPLPNIPNKTVHQAPPTSVTRIMFDLTPDRSAALDALLVSKPNDGFVKSLVSQAKAGKGLSDKQLTALRRIFHTVGMHDKANLFKIQV